MYHPEEHILELYVLNADSVSGRRGEIGEHLRACAGCKALAVEISGFYADLDAELRKEDAVAGDGVGQALARRNSALAVWEERLARSRRSGWKSPVKNLRYFIRRYPIAAAGTTFAFASLAVIGLMMGYRNLSRDVDPAYVLIDPKNASFQTYNAGNALLWKRPIPDFSTTIDDRAITDMPYYAIADVDADGDREVLTAVYLSGEPALPKVNLHVFDGEGKFKDISFERNITWRGDVYNYPCSIAGGSILAVDSSDPGNVEIFVTAKGYRSPTALLRINNRFQVIGEYWHQGHITVLYVRDVDGDGRKELIVGGIDDVDDKADLSYPFIAILDPRKLTGVTESQATRGYGFAPSSAEIRYLRLPVTEINRKRKTGASIGKMVDVDDKLVFLWNSHVPNESRLELEFVFTKSFEPTRVISTTQIHQLFEREFEAGRVSTRLDDACLERLRGEVRFWDGERWVQRPTRLPSEPSH